MDYSEEKEAAARSDKSERESSGGRVGYLLYSVLNLGSGWRVETQRSEE